MQAIDNDIVRFNIIFIHISLIRILIKNTFNLIFKIIFKRKVCFQYLSFNIYLFFFD